MDIEISYWILCRMQSQSYSLNRPQVGVPVQQGISWFLLHQKCLNKVLDPIEEYLNFPCRCCISSMNVFFLQSPKLIGYCKLRCLADIHIKLDLGWTVQNICQCGQCVWDLSNSYGYTYFEHATSPWPRNTLLRPSCYVYMDQVLMFFIYFYCLQSSLG